MAVSEGVTQPPETMFFAKISTGDNSDLELYLKNGGDPNILSPAKIPLLKSTVNFMRFSAAEMLLNYGAKIPEKLPEQYELTARVAPFVEGATLLTMLIEKEVDLNYRPDNSGDSLMGKILRSCLSGDFCKSSIQYSNLTKKALKKVDLSMPVIDFSGDVYAINYIASFDTKTAFDLLAYLLELGANPNIISKSGYVPLDDIVRNKNPGLMLKLLLDNGANPELMNDHSLRIALRRSDVVKIFSTYGYDLEKLAKDRKH